MFEIFLPAMNGVVTVTLTLARELQRRGHRVIVLAPFREDGPAEYRYDGGCIPIHYFSSKRVYFYPELYYVSIFDRTITPLLQKEKVDILHITGPGSMAFAGIRAAKKRAIPIVHTWHTMLDNPLYLKRMVFFDFLVPLIQFLGKYYVRLFMKNIVLTAPSRVSRNYLLSCDARARIHVIPNGVDLNIFNSSEDREHLQRAYPFFNDKTFVFVGRVSHEKSIDHVIEAFSRVALRDKQARLCIVGNGPALKELKALGNKLSLEGRLYFTGQIPHETVLKKGFFSYACAYVNASTSESVGMGLIESICSGLPVVSYDTIASLDVIGDAGILVPKGDIVGLSEAMYSLINNTVLSEAIKNKARLRKKIFDIKNVVREFDALYQQLV